MSRRRSRDQAYPVSRWLDLGGSGPQQVEQPAQRYADPAWPRPRPRAAARGNCARSAECAAGRRRPRRRASSGSRRWRRGTRRGRRRGEIAPDQGRRQELLEGRRIGLGEAEHAGPGGLIERAQHAGEVGQRQGLGAPLVQRPARLALEIDQHDVALGDQDLAQAVVAMAAGLDQARRLRWRCGQELLELRAPCAQNGVDIGGQARRPQSGAAAPAPRGRRPCAPRAPARSAARSAAV